MCAQKLKSKIDSINTWCIYKTNMNETIFFVKLYECFPFLTISANHLVLFILQYYI